MFHGLVTLKAACLNKLIDLLEYSDMLQHRMAKHRQYYSGKEKRKGGWHRRLSLSVLTNQARI